MFYLFFSMLMFVVVLVGNLVLIKLSLYIFGFLYCELIEGYLVFRVVCNLKNNLMYEVLIGLYS